MSYLVLFLLILLLPYPAIATESGGGCEDGLGAKLVSLQGGLSVDARQRGDWQAAQLHQVFCEGARLRVEPYSRASIALPNGITLRLDEGTVLSLNGISANKPTLLDLLKGFVHFISRTPKQLSITTPIANAGPEGTEFALKVDEAEALLWVYEGGVKFFNAQGNIHLNPGESARAQASMAPLARIDISPVDAVNWALYYPPLLPTLPAADDNNSLSAAVRDYRQGHVDAALRRLDGMSTELQNNAFFRVRGAMRLIAGRTALAEQDIQTLLAKIPQDAYALALQSVLALSQNRKNLAHDLASRAVAVDPDSAVTFSALSYAEQAGFALDKALKAAEKAVNLAPNDAMVWARKAELEQANGLAESSAVSAKRALQLDAGLERTQTVMGFVQLSRMNADKARQHFASAVDLDSTSPLARLGLGLTKIRQGELEQGRQDLEIAATLDPGSTMIRSYLGKAYYEEKRDGLAQDQFGLAKQRDPKDPTPYFYDAIRKQTTNRPVEALADMQQAVELNDNRAVYRSKLALDEDAAARTANLARIYNDLGFGRVALKQAWSALNYDSINPTSHRFLSDAYIGRPRYRSARASELLQAQLLQPINITPVQPQLTGENIGILNNSGPGSLTINEYDPLYTANGAHIVMNGAYGSNNTKTDNIVASGVYNNLSVSGGQFHYQTDGFRLNDDYRQDIYDAFAQYAFSPDLNMQIELKSENVRSGDVPMRLNEFHQENYRHAIDHNTARIGSHYRIDEQQDLIGSFFYTTFIDLNKNHDYIALDPNDPLFDFNINSLYRSKAKGHQTEVQYVFHPDGFDIKAGFGYLNIDYDDYFNDFVNFPSGIIPDSASEIFSKSNNPHYNGYIYSNQKIYKYITTVLGLSFDAFDDGLVQRKQFNPKFGIIWQPSNELTVRSAAFRTLKRPLAGNQTIEPTQVAGFNQIFDSINGTSAWQYALGFDYKPIDSLFLGNELFWRKAHEDILDLNGTTTRNRDEFSYLAYLYWAPHEGVSLASEYRIDRFRRDYIADNINLLDPQAVSTHEVPLSLKLFHPSGVYSVLIGTYVKQYVRSVGGGVLNRDDESFWTVDFSVGYRFPKRLGALSFEVKNIADTSFRYQSIFDAEGPQLSPFIPERQLFMKLSLFY